MLGLLLALLGALRAACRPRASLVVENLALRQQLAILRRKTKRPPLLQVDRAFWIVLTRTWSRWAETLTIVKPETVIGWHRRGFARFWAWKSRRVGRPPIQPEVVDLIVRMAKENPTWSRRRIAMELAKLGVVVDKNTVAKYLPKPGGRPRPPSQTWMTFVRNHLAGTLAIDFFTVPTARSSSSSGIEMESSEPSSIEEWRTSASANSASRRDRLGRMPTPRGSWGLSGAS